MLTAAERPLLLAPTGDARPVEKAAVEGIAGQPVAATFTGAAAALALAAETFTRTRRA